MSVNTTTNIPPEVRVYYDRLLLTLARPYFFYDLFAQKRTIPQNSGDQMIFRRYGTLSAATTPLTEAVTPAGQVASVTDMKVQLKQYGAYLLLSDQVQYTIQDRVLNEFTKILSLQLGQTVDTLVRDMMVSTCSTILCSAGGNGGTPTEITDEDIQDASLALRQANARFMTKPVEASKNIGTAPLRASYWGFMSTDLQQDLEAVSSFQSVANYSNMQSALEAEWGQTRNVRWLISTEGYSTGGVYSSFVFGQEAYGAVKLGQKDAEMIVKPLGSAGSTDALNQRGSVGFKFWYACRILNDNWITRLTSTRNL